MPAGARCPPRLAATREGVRLDRGPIPARRAAEIGPVTHVWLDGEVLARSWRARTGFWCCRPGRFGDGTLTEHWNGTVWSIGPSQDLYRVDDVLNAVADLSPGNACAVGSVRPFGPSPITDPLILHWNRSSWQNPGPVAGHAARGQRRSPANAWAVGDDAHDHTVALRLDGTTWSTTARPPPRRPAPAT